MSDVNTELHPSNSKSDREKVAELFGDAPKVVFNAVGNFLKRGPGTLDHHSLRIIATAAPHIRDPKIVAEMIDHLPVTRMHVAAEPIDVIRVSAQFERILPEYQPRVRQRLVDDLVEQTTLRFLTFSPPERLTPEARQVVDGHLLDLARGTDAEQARALASPLATPHVVKTVLDSIERKIVRSERGTTVRAPSKLPLGLVVEALRNVLHRDVECTTSADVERAWKLVRRCEPDADSLESVLWAATASSKLIPEVANSVLEAIDELSDEGGLNRGTGIAGYMRTVMISVPEMPEEVARKAVQKRVESPETLQSPRVVDHRWWLVRRHEYLGRGGQRSLIPTLSSDDLDLRVLKIGRLSKNCIAQMKNGEALRELALESDRLDTLSLQALIRNEHVPHDAVFPSLASEADFASTRDSYRTSRNDIQLIGNPRLTDGELVGVLHRTKGNDRRHRQLLPAAAGNPSAGPEMLNYILQQPNSDELLFQMAEGTTDVATYQSLLRLAVDLLPTDLDTRTTEYYMARGIAEALLNNDTISIVEIDESQSHRTSLSGLSGTAVRELFGTEHLSYQPSIGVLPAHRIREVARSTSERPMFRSQVDRLVSEYDLAIPSDRPAERERTLCLLADEGLLDDVHWARLTRSADTHRALRFATHPKCPTSASSLRPVAVDKLTATTLALDGGLQLPSQQNLRRWDDLPNVKDVPFPVSPAGEAIDGRVVEGAQLRLVRTPKQLAEAAAKMGNCLEGYDDLIASGDRLVALADDGNETIAIAWNIGSSIDGRPKLDLTEINSRFNRGNVRPEFRAAILDMTTSLDRGELQTTSVDEPTQRVGDPTHDDTRAHHVGEATPDLTVDNERRQHADVPTPDGAVETPRAAYGEDEQTPREPTLDVENRAVVRDRVELPHVVENRAGAGETHLIVGPEERDGEANTSRRRPTPRRGPLELPAHQYLAPPGKRHHIEALPPSMWSEIRPVDSIGSKISFADIDSVDVASPNPGTDTDQQQGEITGLDL